MSALLDLSNTSTIISILGIIIGAFSLVSVILFTRVLFKDPVVAIHRIRLYSGTYKLLSMMFLMSVPFMFAFLYAALVIYPALPTGNISVLQYTHIGLEVVLIYVLVIGILFFTLYRKIKQELRLV